MSPCWSPGLHGLFRSPAVPPGLSMRECGATGSASGPVRSTICQVSGSGHVATSLPRLPICAPPTGLDECFFFISLVVRLLCSSIFCQFWLVLFLNLCCPFGCAKRRSVSAYASILVFHSLEHLLYVSGPSVCPPWRSVCSSPLPIF